jgi:integrase/recombinase XerD
MTLLRQRMIQDLQLRGYADRTVEAYVHAVAQLARFYQTSPDQLSEDQVRQYLLHLSTVQKVARGTHTIALCGIKFFYRQTLGRSWTVLDVARPKGEQKLPVVLSRDEVWRVLDAVRIAVYRVCLTTIYACGLRLMEGIRLQVPDVDGDRTLLHIHGKRAKDRYVPLPDDTLALLRDHWRTHRNPAWLFPTGTRSHVAPRGDPAVGPVSRSSLQSAFCRAVKQSGVHKRAHVHTLRRSYATHLLEAGVTLQLVGSGNSGARIPEILAT